ncbi:MAG: hypothetical protein NTV01_08115 [Bacteroidia bacterium]|nr:hypothetical protein [Bacteroidia bacterium]
MEQRIYRLLDWIVFSVAIPIFLPVFCLWLVSMITTIPDNVKGFKAIIVLLNNGVYLFLGASLLIATLENYRKVRDVFTPLIGILMVILVLLTMFLFLSSTNFLPTEKKLSDNLIANIATLICSIFVAGYINFKVDKNLFNL